MFDHGVDVLRRCGGAAIFFLQNEMVQMWCGGLEIFDHGADVLEILKLVRM